MFSNVRSFIILFYTFSSCFDYCNPILRHYHTAQSSIRVSVFLILLHCSYGQSISIEFLLKNLNLIIDRCFYLDNNQLVYFENFVISQLSSNIRPRRLLHAHESSTNFYRISNLTSCYISGYKYYSYIEYESIGENTLVY